MTKGAGMTLTGEFIDSIYKKKPRLERGFYLLNNN
jgi:hypothetical protein